MVSTDPRIIATVSYPDRWCAVQTTETIDKKTHINWYFYTFKQDEKEEFFKWYAEQLDMIKDMEKDSFEARFASGSLGDWVQELEPQQ